MRAAMHRLVTTIVVGLILVARASGPGPFPVVAPTRPGRSGREPDPSANRI